MPARTRNSDAPRASDDSGSNTVLYIVLFFVAVILIYLLTQGSGSTSSSSATTAPPSSSSATSAPSGAGAGGSGGSGSGSAGTTVAPGSSTTTAPIVTYGTWVQLESTGAKPGAYMYGMCWKQCTDDVCTFVPGDSDATHCGGTDDLRTWKFSKTTPTVSPNDTTAVKYGETVYLQLQYGGSTSGWLTGGRSGISDTATDTAGSAFVVKPSYGNPAKTGDPVRDGDLVRLFFPTQQSVVTGERSGNHNVSTEPSGASDSVSASQNGSWDWTVHAVH